jgi:phosphate acyltransferase
MSPSFFFMRIAVDTMGGDLPDVPDGHTPILEETRVNGALMALQVMPELQVLLVGNRDRIHDLLWGCPEDLGRRIGIEHSDTVIPMEAADRELLRLIAADSKAGWKSSVGLAAMSVKAGASDAAISAGNTGGSGFVAARVLELIENVGKPALVATLPTYQKKAVAMADVGLVADRTPYDIVEAALLAGEYAKNVYGITEEIRYGVMSVGSEPGKGNMAVRKAGSIFGKMPVKFAGNVEPKMIYKDAVHAVGVDGFAGNAGLKWIEASAEFIKFMQSQEIRSDILPIRLLNWAMNRRKFARIKQWMSTDHNAAALFIGVNGLMTKAHGDATDEKFAAAILQTAKLTQRPLLATMHRELPPLAEAAMKIKDELKV